jgi:hypothetical protein
MLNLLGVLGTQEILLMAFLLLIILFIPIIAYNQGKKKGRLEGRLEEMERHRNKL